MTTEMFEGPDGLLYANPAECADAWAHEATSLLAALAEAERENEELRRRAEDVADMWQNGMRYVPERNCYEATWTAHQIEKAGREAERLKEIIDRAVKRGDAAMAREEG